jgi:REP element-mobilizing transposase RayT
MTEENKTTPKDSSEKPTYWKEIIPSMKRRCESHDYTERGIYMITIATEGRHPLFGKLEGNIKTTEGPERPHIVLSPLGRKVQECWFAIHHYYPKIKVLKLCMMPDHIHGILFVEEKIEKHLGHIINSFKSGTRKAMRELEETAAAMNNAAMPQHTGQGTSEAGAENTAAMPQHTGPGTSEAGAETAAAMPQHTGQGTSEAGAENAAAMPQHTGQGTSEAGAETAAAMPQHTGQGTSEAGAETAAAMPQLTGQGTGQGTVQGGEASPHRKKGEARKHGTLWETGYNDRILTQKGQLQRMLSYLDDNPRRLLMKRLHPEFFTNLGTHTIVGVSMQAMGNLFLLDNPMKKQVQCSRHLYQKDIDAHRDYFLQEGRKGTILVSPCISDGEKQIATAALHAGISLIVLLLNGFPPLYKPKPRYLEACLNGRLLILAPFPYQTGKITDMRQRCLYLNSLAARICDSE